MNSISVKEYGSQMTKMELKEAACIASASQNYAENSPGIGYAGISKMVPVFFCFWAVDNFLPNFPSPQTTNMKVWRCWEAVYQWEALFVVSTA